MKRGRPATSGCGGASQTRRTDEVAGRDDAPFRYVVTKDGRVRISWRSRVVTTVAGGAASRLIASLDAADEEQAQHLLARATGNFKRGNERESPSRGRSEAK